MIRFLSKRATTLVAGILCAAFCLPPVSRCFAQQPQQPASASAPTDQQNEEGVLPGDWAPELLDAILSSPNHEAEDSLYRAAFAAGPAIIPQLAEALKDDRTAEFAAQSLAFIGGEKAMQVLWKLQEDKRDLNLRRFCYGALGEYDSPQATDLLFDIINKSDSEPDRTVTEAAVLALSLRSDAKLLPRLRAAESKLQDVVIRDDLENASDAIASRAKYLASPAGKKAGSSVDEAVKTYFEPALDAAPPAADPAAQSAAGKSSAAKPARPAPPAKPLLTVDIRHLVLSPDMSRALAHVRFEDPAAIAEYDIVLQKRLGDWTVASVWLGAETEKPQASTANVPAEEN